MWSRKKNRVVEPDCRLAFFCNSGSEFRSTRVTVQLVKAVRPCFCVALLRLSKTVPNVQHVRPALQFYGDQFSLFSFELERDTDVGVGRDADGNWEHRVVVKGDLAPFHLRVVSGNQEFDEIEETVYRAALPDLYIPTPSKLSPECERLKLIHNGKGNGVDEF